jgi:hypothetical protein
MKKKNKFLKGDCANEKLTIQRRTDFFPETGTAWYTFAGGLP